MAEHFLYLTTIGRTTGSERQIEIWFVERGGSFYVVAERREETGWVKNLLKQPSVAFSVGSRDARESVQARTAATARVVQDSEVKALMDAKYGWSDGLVVELSPLPRR
jgi:deazaflavin-dependent oxidoreductase (nitroreductase family)